MFLAPPGLADTHGREAVFLPAEDRPAHRGNPYRCNGATCALGDRLRLTGIPSVDLCEMLQVVDFMAGGWQSGHPELFRTGQG
jgi:hypothetical protein